jgi:nitrite reductase/ring-hydroxylating ferredoxin subunit
VIRQASPTMLGGKAFERVQAVPSQVLATGMPGRAQSRFPFSEYPKGWFQVAYSREVDNGEIFPLHYFGTRLICYRGESGSVQVLDAHCPHLGADIGVGGTVSRDCVVCPFHGWKFDADGRNVDIPYAKSVNRVARLRSWRHHGLGRSCTVLTVTPIDGEYVDARYTFFVLTEPETGEMTRMGLGFVRDFCKQIEQDIPIWENKVFRDRPQLARGESAITEFRAWAVQSYERESSEESTPASQ